MEALNTVQCSSPKVLVRHSATWTWTRLLPSPGFLYGGENDVVHSPPFSVCEGVLASLSMFQSGGENDTANLYLNRDEKSYDGSCVGKDRHFILSVGPLSVTVPASHLNEDDGPVLCIPHSSLVEALHLYSPEGVLTVVVTLHSAVEVVPTPTVAVPPSSLASDLYRLLESGTGSYTTLVCGSKRFPVHSDILCARSPVFAAQMRWPMLASPMTEVQVDGIEAPILGRLLQFVYTDELEPPPYAEEAMHLLNAASFYNLPRLLAICESVLVDSLAVDNVALVLTLAEQHGVQSLKHEALRFFAANVPGVIATEGWAHLKSATPALVEQAFLALYAQHRPAK